MKPRTCVECIHRNSPRDIVKKGFCGLPGAKHRAINDPCDKGELEEAPKPVEYKVGYDKGERAWRFTLSLNGRSWVVARVYEALFVCDVCKALNGKCEQGVLCDAQKEG